MDGAVTEGEDIGGAVIQAFAADERNIHADEAVVAVKPNGPRSVIFVLYPVIVHEAKRSLEPRIACGEIIVSMALAE